MEMQQCPFCHKSIEGRLWEVHIRDHQRLLADGQQKDYVTLPTNERVQGDLDGVPVVYVHKLCGTTTRMPEEIVRSYLQNPFLYSADNTFCSGCGKHVPFSVCHWTETGVNLQKYFDELRAAKRVASPDPLQAVQAKPSLLSRLGPMLAFIALAAIGFAVNFMQDNGDKEQNIVGNGPVALAKEEAVWNEKMKRGEDVPEAILTLAGIDPQQYKTRQKQLRLVEARQLAKEGRYDDAIKALDEKLKTFTDDEALHNQKAWILATCPKDTVRDGKQAIAHATKACELTEYRNPFYIDTLAAAFAEAGEFESALQQMERAIPLIEDPAAVARFNARMDSFKSGNPFRSK
jgi:hypothetical protein